MIKRLSDSLTDRLVTLDETNASSREIYSYGFEYMFSLIMSSIIVITITLLLDVKLEALGFILGFGILRASTGGYHSRTHFGCQTLSFVIFLTTMLIAKYVDFYTPCMIIILSMLTCLIVFKLAPIEHVNRPFSSKEFTKFKSTSRIKIVSMSYICLLGYLLVDFRPIFKGLLLSIIIVTVSLFIAFVLDRSVYER